MARIRLLRKSLVVLTFLAALGTPTVAMAYPVIGDDPGDPAAQIEGHAWYAALLKRTPRSTLKPKPKPVDKPTSRCHPKVSKTACPLR
jgi:hypothetical protein